MAAGTDSRKSRKSESQNEEEEEMEMEEEPDFGDPEGFVDDITDEGKLLYSFTFIALCGTSYAALLLWKDWALFLADTVKTVCCLRRRQFIVNHGSMAIKSKLTKNVFLHVRLFPLYTAIQSTAQVFVQTTIL